MPSPPDQTIKLSHCLQSHPAVDAVAVLRDGQSGWIAFVEPSETYLDESLERSKAQEAALQRWRKSFDLTQFTSSAKSNPVGMNIQGWNSSYTGEQMSVEEMQEWVQITVEQIQGFAPKAVYEIGCGTGMLLLRIAPQCERYVAADFSSATLDRLRAQIESLPALKNLAELSQRSANDYSGFAEDSFDTVVINSTAQYFPSRLYLTQVLEGAIKVVRPGGRVFVGDVQSLPLQPLFDTSVEIFRADDDLKVAQLRERIQRRKSMHPWLFISPAYFLALPNIYRKVSRVEISPRMGRADNEVTRYRYNSILYIGSPTGPSRECEFDDWREHRWALDEIKERLRERPAFWGISHVSNARVTKDVVASEVLRNADVEMTTRALRNRRDDVSSDGIHPEDLLQIAKENVGVEVKLSWAAGRRDGSFDVVFLPIQKMQEASAPILWPTPHRAECMTLTSWPGQTMLRSHLVESLRAHCVAHLSPDLVPTEIILVDRIPREEQGGVDLPAILEFRELWPRETTVAGRPSGN
jgi:ubiquinone/menaquinone biosynthesis C-methylase UbiE